ncbi:MAG TPA: QueT transporter family protein [Clostridiales bacterium]|nr:QueT transporter family protein [Clostridiales bacterium]
MSERQGGNISVRPRLNYARFLTQAAIIAAVYTVLTLVFAPLSYGESMIQVRISEMLTILPYYTPAAIPGLFVGAIVSNLFSPVGAVDVILGSLATLIAAYLSYRIPDKWLVPIPPIAVNGLVIGGMLHYVYEFPLLLSILSVTAGQTVSCYIFGGILMAALEKTRQYIFPEQNRG